MKKLIRLTESDLHKIIREAVETIIREEGEAGGGGATNAAGVMQGGGTNPGAGTYDVPAFGGKTNKKKVGGNAFSEPIMRQAHNLGDVTSAKVNQVDMKPALKRGGSIAMGESIRRNKMIDEAVDEGIGNWLKGAALGGMLAMSPMQANAQTQDYQQQGDAISMTKKNKGIFIHKYRSPEELMKLYPQVYADRNKTPQEWITNARKGKYDDLVTPEGKILFSIKSAAIKGLNPWDELVNNFRGEDFEINMKDIEPPKTKEFTQSDSIDVLKGNGSPRNNSVNGAIVSFFRNNRNITPKQTRNIRTISANDLMFNTEKVNLPSDIKNYKLVKISGGPFLLMPINYTLQNVQAEMGL